MKDERFVQNIAKMILWDDGDSLDEIVPLARRIVSKVKRHLTQRALDGAVAPKSGVMRQRRRKVGGGGPVKSPRK